MAAHGATPLPRGFWLGGIHFRTKASAERHIREPVTRKGRRPLSRRRRFAILERDEFRCCYCGRSAPAVTLEVEHIISLKDGGDDDDLNLAAACHDCNAGKSARSVHRGPMMQVYSDRGNLVAQGTDFEYLRCRLEREMDKPVFSCAIYETHPLGLLKLFDAWRDSLGISEYSTHDLRTFSGSARDGACGTGGEQTPLVGLA